MIATDRRNFLRVRPDQLRALPKDGKLGQNQIPAALNHVVQKPNGVRLEFENDLAVEMQRLEYEKYDRVKEWVVQFPPDALRVV